MSLLCSVYASDPGRHDTFKDLQCVAAALGRQERVFVGGHQDSVSSIDVPSGRILRTVRYTFPGSDRSLLCLGGVPLDNRRSHLSLDERRWDSIALVVDLS